MSTRLRPLARAGRRASACSRVVPLHLARHPGVFGGAARQPRHARSCSRSACSFGGLALTYDLLFGFTGLLSFGHALYFAIGVYLADDRADEVGLGLRPGARSVVARRRRSLLPLVLGAVSLRVGGIAFAMVTLAFAQAGPVLVAEEPGRPDRRRGGARPRLRRRSRLRSSASSTRSTSTGSRSATPSSCSSSCAGRSNSLAGPRLAGDPRERAAGRGARPAAVPLQAARVRARVVPRHGRRRRLRCSLIGGASPEVTTPSFTLTLLVMVVIGGAGTRYGALLGGFLYTLARPPARLARGLVARSQDLPTVLGRRSRSRSSSSARSSSCSSSSCPAGSSSLARPRPRGSRRRRPRRHAPSRRTTVMH